MNIVLDEASEVNIKDGKSTSIGRIQAIISLEVRHSSIYVTGRMMLKGDNITLIQAVQEE